MHDYLDEKFTLPRQENGRFRGLILEGRPGIGKSALAKTLLASALVVSVGMGTRTYETFGSLPVAHDRNGDGDYVVKRAMLETSVEPLLAENIGKNNGILILDDLTLADMRLQNAALDLVQLGRIGEQVLGENVLVVITGNGILDGADACPWSAALLGRCALVRWEPQFDSWLGLPIHRDIDPATVGFLKEYPSFFAPKVNDSQYADEGGKTPAPREWTTVGRMIGSWGGYRGFIPSLLYPSALAKVEAEVGSKAATALDQFSEVFGVYPDSDKLLDEPGLWHKLDASKRQNLGAVFGVAHGLKSAFYRRNPGSNEGEVNRLFRAIGTIAEDNLEVFGYTMNAVLQDAIGERNYGLAGNVGRLVRESEFSQSAEGKQLLASYARFNEPRTLN